MILIKSIINTNLSQALKMSIYTWGLAILIGVLVLFFEHLKLKTVAAKSQFYQIAIVLLTSYTLVTGLIWFYYFTLILFVPFFVLQLLLIFKFYRLNPLNRTNSLF